MYVPAAYQESRVAQLHAQMRAQSFAILVTEQSGSLMATHLPLLLDEARGPNGTLIGHLARANPQWHALQSDREVLAIFQGPHAYVSPAWYQAELAVPTWNYVAIHAYGPALLLDDPAAVREYLARLVDTSEGGRPEPWDLARLPSDYVSQMVKAIVASQMPISRLEGKFKLSQNRPRADQQGVVEALVSASDPLALGVAELMAQRLATGGD